MNVLVTKPACMQIKQGGTFSRLILCETHYRTALMEAYIEFTWQAE